MMCLCGHPRDLHFNDGSFCMAEIVLPDYDGTLDACSCGQFKAATAHEGDEG